VTTRFPAWRFALMVWLVALWQLLWRDVSLANLAAGAAVAGLVTTIRPGRPHLAAGHRIRPLRLLAFLGYFAWLLVESNLVVAREIVTRRDHIRSGIVAVPLGDSSELVTTVLADAITLTPGTLSLEVGEAPPMLYVHVLHVRDVEGVRRDVLRLQRLVSRAIGPAAPLDRPDRDVPHVPSIGPGGRAS
jgi:multicomponent Na+:H+ antiporter subunit E